MIESKKINIIAAAAMALVVLLTAVMVSFSDVKSPSALTASSEPLYARKIFGSDVITVDIIADENDWQEMIDNAMNEEYIMADVVINGSKFSRVGIRPKGNNSLQQVASSESDRYSFKIKFDEYVEGQTCFGLDMLVLNNMIGDSTCMKEYTTFDMMKTMGIETPYFSYSQITVNNEDWGFYFAIEAYNDSYEQRVSGDESGVLYNVKNSNGFGGKNFGEKPDSGEKLSEESSRGVNEKFTGKSNRSKGGMGNGDMGASSSGGALIYTDNNASSYSAIFGNAVGSNSGEEDYQRVIAALKALNDGENIEQYFDVDEILRYLAVHTVVVNLDSYSSNMAQNYYIYEYNGVLRILPWDYNYAWGAFQSGNASSVVNFPIDTPVSGVEMSERPLISKLFENEEYFERYRSYLKELMDKYFADGRFELNIDMLDAVIGEYVKNDPSAFCTYEEYKTALSAFKSLAMLRMESIYGQLKGTVPSTTDEQNKSKDKLIDASSVNLSDLGSGMGGGHGFGNFGGMDFSDRMNRDNENTEHPADLPAMNGTPPDLGNIPQMPDFGDANEFPQMPQDGNFPPDGEMPQMPFSENESDGNHTEENPPQNFYGGNFGNTSGNGREFSEMNSENNANDMTFAENKQNNSAQTDRKNMVVTAVSAGILIAAIIGVSCVKRKF